MLEVGHCAAASAGHRPRADAEGRPSGMASDEGPRALSPPYGAGIGCSASRSTAMRSAGTASVVDWILALATSRSQPHGSARRRRADRDDVLRQAPRERVIKVGAHVTDEALHLATRLRTAGPAQRRRISTSHSHLSLQGAAFNAVADRSTAGWRHSRPAPCRRRTGRLGSPRVSLGRSPRRRLPWQTRVASAAIAPP